jgi:phosphoglycolate phosphatase-like HAD superfamily hydrolase
MRYKGTYAAYVFDFDGTLFELPVDWKAVRRDLYAITRVHMEDVSIFKVIKQLTLGQVELRADLFAAIDAHEVPAAELATPVEGALDLISSLATRAGIALVTMQGKPACTRVLSRYGVSERFHVVITREDSLDRVDQLRAAAKALDVHLQESLFVGDKRGDLEAGREVGARVALVGTRARKEWRPDYFCPKLKDLGAILG